MSERVFGNIFVRTMHFKNVGDKCDLHEHKFDHVSLVLTGAVKIRCFYLAETGEWRLQWDKDFYAPKQVDSEGENEAQVLIKANIRHEIIALEDNTHCWCVFSCRDDKGEVVENFEGDLSITY